MPEAALDRVPDALAGGTPEPLRAALTALLGGEQVLCRVSDLVRYATDASPYRLLPRAVVLARDADDVRAVLAYGRANGVPVTLRSAGTSLCGQAQGDGILIDVRRHWRGVEVLGEDAAQVRVKPGTVVGHVNRVLARRGRKLGPDPASVEACTVGGVIANNSGGMRCGTTADAYSTVRSMTLLLASGTLIDTAAPGAAARFATAEPALAQGLAALRDELRADVALAARVRQKFAIKNTTGYRLCAFLDADEPLEIFRRLVVGSEGTLALIAEAVLDTVPVPARSAVAWLHFADIDAAVAPVAALVDLGASAVELVGAELLHVAADTMPGAPAQWRELPVGSAALLVELAAGDDEALDAMERAVGDVLGAHALLAPVSFSRTREAVAAAWRVRNGKFGLFGRVRPAGSSMILEDVCVPPAQFADAVRGIQALMVRHGFPSNVSGHVSAGNVHFYLAPALDDPDDLRRFEALIDDLVALVIDEHDGSLKAEHGTGRMMAPFVEREWGATATEMMWRVKALADPDGVLAPGVVLNRDPRVHMANLQSSPAIDAEVTTCVECGLCEPVCPSRWLTTTPRQRIVLRRELARQRPGSPVALALAREYEHDALDTCAADGSCAIACPLGIDTGALVKTLRAERHGPLVRRAARATAARWGVVERAARGALRAGHLLGDRASAATSTALRRVAGAERMPAWTPPMPAPAAAGASGPTGATRAGAHAVYLPACVNRIFDPGGLPHALLAVSERAGRPLWVPPHAAGHCCATPFASKGHAEAAEQMARTTLDALREWSGDGALPIVIDASSCALGLREHAARLAPQLEIRDAIEWVHDLLPALAVPRRVARVALHPTCSVRHLGLEATLEELAGALADDVFTPAAATCCGMAGDRGLHHPDLTAAALADEARELRGERFDAHLCGNRTCEIALERATGAHYESPVVLLERLTRQP
jgi:D-lactate dehydrogenase